jgi:uncharacterized protein
MFHTIITTAYIIPNVYLFLRIWYLFINKEYKIHYTIIYLLLVSIYPVSNFLHENNGGLLVTTLAQIGNYILPFFLYLLLSVLAFDFFLLVNYIFKLIPSTEFKKTRFKITGLLSVILFSVCVVLAGVINFNTIRTSEYQIDVPGRYTEISRLKVAFAADFHLQENTNIRFMERFVRKIELIKPDILLLGGDIVEGDRENENMVIFEKLFKDIRPRYGVFTVLGNHEYYGGQDKGSFFEKAGIKVLCDTIVSIDSAFNLGGRYDSHFRIRKPVGELMKPVNETLPLILVDHRPTEIAQISQTNTDIQLSGHTHNGQLFPINLITKSVYILSWGYRKI